MLSQSFIEITATLLVPLIAATSSCQPSNFGADLSNFTNTCNEFCTKPTNQSFTQDTMFYGVQKSIIEFHFTPQNGTNGTCNLNACLSDVSALAKTCQRDSHSIYGSGSTDLGCGTYNFTITEQTPLPALSATKTGKADVGSTALGNGASILRGSGYTLVGVACAFVWFL